MECLYDNGLSKEEIEKRVGISQAEMNGSDILIPYRQLLDLWQLAVNVTGNKALAIYLRDKYGKDHTHFTYVLSMNSQTVLEALENLKRFSPLICESEEIDFYLDDEFVTILYTNTSPLYQNIWMPEHMFCFLAKYGRSQIDEKLNPVNVHFQHVCPEEVATYENYFQSPVLFRQDENFIRYKKEVLLQQLENQNLHLQTVLKNKAESDLKLISKGQAIEKKVRGYITRQLATGRLNIEMTASALNMSRSTLHRKLREESITFDLVLKDVRMTLTKSFLEQGMSTTQMSNLLGYSNASNFNKAFKLWFGESPGAYRKRMMTLTI